ncbi:hypothetical protein SAMN06265219_12128 [Gracilimonas mengyeensis]|uniref:Uncharacterized protein n=1 Tax=Gracilimonas mengyeensis TaxID=1302730 RepID=A0A521FKR2_9BACT|nr:hypothetical protein SAMN06265219_12128 [Gracilimonas mengyeensis]
MFLRDDLAPTSHPARSRAEMRDLLGTGNALAKEGFGSTASCGGRSRFSAFAPLRLDRDDWCLLFLVVLFIAFRANAYYLLLQASRPLLSSPSARRRTLVSVSCRCRLTAFFYLTSPNESSRTQRSGDAGSPRYGQPSSQRYVFTHHRSFPGDPSLRPEFLGLRSG